MTDPPNLGPNLPGFCPNPWGLLDFQDIAIFYWPDLRDFSLEEQCLILKHRNARLKDITPEELERIEEWMSDSDTINIEGRKVDLWEWRKGLKNKELRKLVKKMEEDLKWATGMWDYKNPATRKDDEVPKHGLSHRSKEHESSKSAREKRADGKPKQGLTPRRSPRRKKSRVIEYSSDDELPTLGLEHRKKAAKVSKSPAKRRKADEVSEQALPSQQRKKRSVIEDSEDDE
ncbi:hypothetical protein OEA41_004896 [Lepraria neglecta]|uniref:Uncharacterized protein n=1 Tax=Lepraria neglecta TaxID=209136 RepID=A0AAE0DIN1_9LECA|nr:hypothetical protein OEA41_004896 [Lepraria neglecta]